MRQTAPELPQGLEMKIACRDCCCHLSVKRHRRVECGHQEPSDGRSFLCLTQQQRRGSASRVWQDVAELRTKQRQTCLGWGGARYVTASAADCWYTTSAV